MNPLPLFQLLVMYINHIWAANVTENVPESQNKDKFYLQPLFKARDSPYVDTVHRKYETVSHVVYPVYGIAISDKRINAKVRKTSHRMSRSPSVRTYLNRVTYVASNRGKMARVVVYLLRNISKFISRAILKKLRSLIQCDFKNKIFQQLLLLLMPFAQSKWFHA